MSALGQGSQCSCLGPYTIQIQISVWIAHNAPLGILQLLEACGIPQVLHLTLKTEIQRHCKLLLLWASHILRAVLFMDKIRILWVQLQITVCLEPLLFPSQLGKRMLSSSSHSLSGMDENDSSLDQAQCLMIDANKFIFRTLKNCLLIIVGI